MERYWPGALTIVYPCKKNLVPSFVRGKGENLGVRMPNHKTSLSLIESVGVPILGPSANFHEKKTPYKYDQLDKELVRLVDYVIAGKCKIGNVSTVVDCSTAPWKIIRDGAVKIKL
jgi:L-threonylcarbamoyladenylate synthase